MQPEKQKGEAMARKHRLRNLDALVLGGVLLLSACQSRDDYTLGKRYFEKGNFAQAIPHLQAAAEKNSQDPRPLEKLAKIYFREENYEQAVQVLEKLRQLKPDSGEVAARYALALRKAGKLGEATVAAHEALELPEVRSSERMQSYLQQLLEELEGKVPSAGRAEGASKREEMTTEGVGLAAEGGTTLSAARDLSPCAPLPAPPISREDLVRLVPDDAPGRVLIRWRTETQEDNLGFNIYRSENPDGPYVRVNRSLIPGEGSTNIPKDYCFEDKPLPRGQVFYYYIEAVSLSGVREILEGTKGTRVKVKTVQEEREWLWGKVMGGESATTSPAIQRAEPRTTLTANAQPTRIPVARFTVNFDTLTSTPAASDPLY